MLVFIPTTDYATSAAAAETIGYLDFGPIPIGQNKTAAFRVGNVGPDAVQVVLTVVDEGGEVVPDFTYQLEPDAFTLGPDEISDTVSVRVATPYIRRSFNYVVDLVATPDIGDEAALTLTYEVVGPTVNRCSHYPRRANDQTDNFADIIETLGDDLSVRVFEPVACVGGSVQVEGGDCLRDLTGDAANTRFISPCDPCERLNPLNPTMGYVGYAYVIRAQFQREQRSITTHLLADNTVMTYHVAASLIVPAPWESILYRNWALFSPASGADKGQFKRTVVVVQRHDELYAVENVRTLDGPNQAVSHFECDLVQLHDRAMGSPDFYNPFALTYEFESDKPYAAYACDLFIPLISEDPYIPAGS